MINALHNSKNPYQGKAKKVPCVCSAGLLRSPTAATVLEQEFGYNTRACGIDTDHALIPISDVLLYWAEEIVCMDAYQKKAILTMLAEFNKKNMYIPEHTPEVYSLTVPDRFERMDANLQIAILDSYKNKERGEDCETESISL